MDTSDRALTLRRRGMDNAAIGAILGLTTAEVEHAIRDSAFDPSTGALSDHSIFTGGSVSVTSAAAYNPDLAEVQDPSSHFTLANTIMGGTDTQLNVADAGVYLVELTLAVSAAGAYRAEIELRHYNPVGPAHRAGSPYVWGENCDTPSGSAPTFTRSKILDLVANDVLVPMARHNAGTNRNLALNARILKLS